METMRLSYAIAVGAAGVLVACGGSDLPDEEEISAVFAAYQAAAEAGDGKTLCEDVLAPSQLQDGGGLERCVQGFDRPFQRRSFQRLPKTELGEITIEGNFAEAKNATEGGFFEFTFEDGRWGLILFR